MGALCQLGRRRAEGPQVEESLDLGRGIVEAVDELSKKIREQGGELRLSSLNEDLRTLFELTKLDTLFKIADTRDEALQGF